MRAFTALEQCLYVLHACRHCYRETMVQLDYGWLDWPVVFRHKWVCLAWETCVPVLWHYNVGLFVKVQSSSWVL
jgi:hypothetical protein